MLYGRADIVTTLKLCEAKGNSIAGSVNYDIIIKGNTLIMA